MDKHTTPPLLRLYQIIGSPERGLNPLIPVSRSGWYEGIKRGIYPKPVKVGGIRASFWRAEDVRALLESAE